MPLRVNIRILCFNLQKDIFILIVIFLQIYHGVVLDDYINILINIWLLRTAFYYVMIGAECFYFMNPLDYYYKA